MLEGIGWGREREGKLVDFAEPTCALALALIFKLKSQVAP